MARQARTRSSERQGLPPLFATRIRPGAALAYQPNALGTLDGSAVQQSASTKTCQAPWRYADFFARYQSMNQRGATAYGPGL